MITIRLTSEAQTTIPQAVREALELREGDDLAYVIEEGRVLLTRWPALSLDGDPFALFEEWGGEEDRRAYAGL